MSWLSECVQADLIRIYRVDATGSTAWSNVDELASPAHFVSAKFYLEYLRFDQQLRAKSSKYPAPPDHPPINTGASYVTHMSITRHTDAMHMNPEAEASSKAKALTGGSEADLWPPTSGEKNYPQPPAEKNTKKKHFKGAPRPSPDKLDADYDRVDIPRLDDPNEVHCIEDLIILAMAVSKDREQQSWKGWVGLLTRGRKRLGREKADKWWRSECTTFFAEINADETVHNNGSALTAKLKVKMGEV